MLARIGSLTKRIRIGSGGVLLQLQIFTRPELWMLGSSDFGGLLAAQLGIRFAFAHFINAQYGHRVAEAYRERFVAGQRQKPYLAAAVFVICANTDKEALALENAVDMRRVQMAYGQNQSIPSIEQGIRQTYSERELVVIAHEKARSIIGTPERATAQMHALQEQFQADELIVISVAGSYAARTRSYELLAEAFALG